MSSVYSSEEEKLIAAVGYPVALAALLGLIFLKNSSAEAKFHFIQAIALNVIFYFGLLLVNLLLMPVLLIFSFLLGPLAGFISVFYSLFFSFIVLAFTLLMLFLAWQAFSEKPRQIPVLSSFIRKTFDKRINAS
ncbi:MAG TPA: hypothetical protein VJK05_05780 [archaeon]|nr:hypothetical protein [archaeon]